MRYEVLLIQKKSLLLEVEEVDCRIIELSERKERIEQKLDEINEVISEKEKYRSNLEYEGSV